MLNPYLEFDLGMDYDELCQKIHIKGSVVAKGLAETNSLDYFDSSYCVIDPTNVNMKVEF